MYKADKVPESFASSCELNLTDQRRFHNLRPSDQQVHNEQSASELPTYPNTNNNLEKPDGNDENYDDTDVITQAVRDATYVYNRASNYLNTEATTQSQCCLQ